jgi:chromosome segregation ATPase
MESPMAWLQDHMRSHVANSLSLEPTEKILHFPDAFASAANAQRETALDLVNQAAEVVMSIEAQAAEIEACARNLARDACEKLQLAESHINSLEAARRMAEQGMNDANMRAQEAEQALKEALSRVAAAEAELYAIEQRVKAAETRADETQQTLTRVENVIRTKLLNLRRAEVNKRATAA